MDELTLGDKIYISSKKAAQITGYAKDYVGQLCRGGYIEARMVGRNWYVLESSIRAHRFGNETKKEQPKAEEGKIAGANPLHQGWEAPTYAPESPAQVHALPHVAPKAAEMPYAAPVLAVAEPDDTLTDMQEAWKEWFARKQQTQQAPQTAFPADMVLEMSASSAEAPEFAEEAAAEPAFEAEEEPEAEEIVEEPAEEEAEIVETAEFVPIRRASAAYPAAPASAEPVHASVSRPIYSSAPVSHPVFDMTPAHAAEAVEPVGRIVEERFVAPKATKAARGASPALRQTRTSRRREQGSRYLLTTVALIALMGLAVTVTILGTGFGDAYNYRTGAQYSAIHYFNGAAVYQATKQ